MKCTDYVAEEIASARFGVGSLDGASVSLAVADADAAYAVQKLVRERVIRTGMGRSVGYKIGMSSRDAQMRHGLSEPIFGHVFSSRLLNSPATLPLKKHQRVGVECEIAVQLRHDLLPGDGPCNELAVLAALGRVYPAIEIVEQRFSFMDAATIWALAADDMLCFGGVIGDGLPNDDPFALSTSYNGRISVDDSIDAVGNSEMISGYPLEYVSWLSNRLNSLGSYLKEGDVIFCGSLTEPIWIDSNSLGGATTVVVEVAKLGRATLSIEWE